jgi:nesprin-1
MDQWKEFDSWFERCSNWLKDVETKVKDTELKATLKDKQNQLDRLRKLQEELNARQGDIDALSDSAQDLVRISTDTRVISQSSQLATKYQTLKVNVKVSCFKIQSLLFRHVRFRSF